MAKLTAMPSLAIVNGFKGTIDFFYCRGIPCARSWPKSPGHTRSQNVMRGWAPFTTATKLWKTLSPTVRAAYDQMAAQTNLRPIDVFVRGYIAGTLRFYRPPDQLP